MNSQSHDDQRPKVQPTPRTPQQAHVLKNLVGSIERSRGTMGSRQSIRRPRPQDLPLDQRQEYSRQHGRLQPTSERKDFGARFQRSRTPGHAYDEHVLNQFEGFKRQMTNEQQELHRKMDSISTTLMNLTSTQEMSKDNSHVHSAPEGSD